MTPPEYCPHCGDMMRQDHSNYQPTWSDTHDDVVCWWCATHTDEVAS